MRLSGSMVHVGLRRSYSSIPFFRCSQGPVRVSPHYRHITLSSLPNCYQRVILLMAISSCDVPTCKCSTP